MVGSQMQRPKERYTQAKLPTVYRADVALQRITVCHIARPARGLGAVQPENFLSAADRLFCLISFFSYLGEARMGG
jgi:hypothetical protein